MPDAPAPAYSDVPAGWEEFDNFARPRLLAFFAYVADMGLDAEHIVQDALVKVHETCGPDETYGDRLAWAYLRGGWLVSDLRRFGFGKYERPTGDLTATVPAAAVSVPGPEREAVDRVTRRCDPRQTDACRPRTPHLRP